MNGNVGEVRAVPLSPKSKTHVRSLMHALLEFAMWAGLLEMNRNPISLVQNKGATRKVRKARSLTVEQFRALLKRLNEPFGTMALLCVCLGLRISEALALRWEDVDWLGEQLSIRRGIVAQHVDECKTEGSAKTLVLADELLDRLRAWKQTTAFSDASDWIFASPLQLGRLPYSYTGIRRLMTRAAEAAEIGHLTTHAFRHYAESPNMPHAVSKRVDQYLNPWLIRSQISPAYGIVRSASQTLEETQQLIFRSVKSSLAFYGSGPRQDFFFQSKIGIEIDLSGFY